MCEDWRAGVKRGVDGGAGRKVGSSALDAHAGIRGAALGCGIHQTHRLAVVLEPEVGQRRGRVWELRLAVVDQHLDLVLSPEQRRGRVDSDDADEEARDLREAGWRVVSGRGERWLLLGSN